MPRKKAGFLLVDLSICKQVGCTAAQLHALLVFLAHREPSRDIDFDSGKAMQWLNLSRQQYRSALQRLTDVGLVAVRGGKNQNCKPKIQLLDKND